MALDILLEPSAPEAQQKLVPEFVVGKAADLQVSGVLDTAASFPWPCLDRQSRSQDLQQNPQLLHIRQTRPDTHTLAYPCILRGEILANPRLVDEKDLDDLNLRAGLGAFPVVEQGMTRLTR